MQSKPAKPGRVARGKEAARRPSPKPRVLCPEVRAAIRYRENRGISQTDFATEFGLSFYTYRQWESGDRTPGLAARILLRVIVQSPDEVRRAVAPKPSMTPRY